jgi:hypothetical protein
MSNPTTPFSWQMPTNTDLVTDLPADFEVFGQAVATSMADLLGGTTGQILAKATNTNMDFVWVDNQVGDITSITATSPLTGGGTGGDVTVGIQASSTTQSGAVQLSDSTSTTSSVLAATPTAVKSAYDLATAAIPKSTVTTSGDVIYATGSSAVTRLGIGSAGQVLTVSSGLPAWTTPAGGGGMTSIASGSLSGSSLSLTSISGSYKNLQLILRDVAPSTATILRLKINNNTGEIYDRLYLVGSNDTVSNSMAQGQTSILCTVNSASTQAFKSWVMNFYDYAKTTSNKQIDIFGSYSYANGQEIYSANATARDANALTRIDVTLDSGSFSGGTYTLYGVN